MSPCLAGPSYRLARTLSLLALFAGLASPAAATPQSLQVGAAGAQTDTAPSPFPRGRILVSGFNSNAVHAFDLQTGALEDTLDVPGAQSIVRGPDDFLYVCAEAIDQVLRVDPLTLDVVAPFVWDDPLTMADESGGLSGPTGAHFGPDGAIYVASFNTDEVLRFDGATGAFLGVFVTAGSGGLNGPDAGFAFGPDGALYVPSFWSNRVLRYDGSSGAFLEVFIGGAGSGLSRPRGLVFRGDRAYVASSGNGRVQRYDLAGGLVDTFATSPTPYAVAFQPNDGDLYVVNLGPDTVSRHDGVDGALLSTPVASGAGGLDGATYLFFLPD